MYLCCAQRAGDVDEVKLILTLQTLGGQNGAAAVKRESRLPNFASNFNATVRGKTRVPLNAPQPFRIRQQVRRVLSERIAPLPSLRASNTARRIIDILLVWTWSSAYQRQGMRPQRRRKPPARGRKETSLTCLLITLTLPRSIGADNRERSNRSRRVCRERPPPDARSPCPEQLF
jgi:hypothetical protein